jgi:hypothetical protein
VSNFDRVVSVTWQGVPMRDALMSLAKSSRVGLFIDRRVDPSITINFKAENKTVKQVFQSYADSAGFYCYFFGSVVYLGRAEMRDIFPKLVLQHRTFLTQNQNNTTTDKSYSAARMKLSKLINVKLPMLSEPKNVLKNLAQQHQFTWQNLDKMPHDVWADNVLPSMPLNDFLILVLVGFDLDYVCVLPDDKNVSNKVILKIIDISK